MELKFLGRGSAFNVKEGNTSAYIKDNHTLLLIDCGSNVFERIINKHLLDDVNHVYVAITHRHPDHIGSLGDLIFYCFYIKHIKVNIISEDYSISDFLLLTGITNDKYEILYDNKIESMKISIEFNYASHCKIYKDAYGDISEAYYMSEYSKNIFDCYSISINNNYEKIFYSGDINYIDFYENKDFDKYYIDCCFADYLNNIHMNVDKLYKLVKESGVDINKIWCMHFDSDEAIIRAKALGFNVVEIEE